MDDCTRCRNIDAVGQDSHVACESSLCTVCDRFDQLNKQILETKVHLDALLDERQKLKWELNYMHKSMVDRMPVEVASTIFEFYAVATRNYWNIAAGGYGMALTLGAVCQSWRRIVWSTPSVWNWITVVLDGTVNPVVIELAVEWLGRSGRLPLSIELFGPSSPSDLEPQLPVVLPLIHAVNECSDRWDNLTLHLPSSFLSYFHDTRGSSETMSCLEVWTGPTSVTMNIRSITPKKVDIICLELNDSLLDWNRTSILSMSDSYTIYECVEVMRQAPQLRRCTFSKVDSGTPELLLNMSVCEHTELTCLHIDLICQTETMAFFFDNITLPALSDLTFCLPSFAVPMMSFTAFLRRSSCPLKTFSLLRSTVTGSELVELAPLMPALSSLSLHCGIFEDNHATLEPFYHSFSLPLTGPGLASDRPYFPCLESLELWANTTFPDELIHGLFHHFSTQVYATRRPLEKVLMILYNRDEQDPFISPPTLREISYLQSQGMEFEIITYLDNKAKDFLQLSLERHSGERSAD